MSVIILLIIISIIVAVFFLGIFFWAVNSGQYDDTYSPSVRMLFEDKKPDNRKSRNSKSTTQQQAGTKSEGNKGK